MSIKTIIQRYWKTGFLILGLGILAVSNVTLLLIFKVTDESPRMMSVIQMDPPLQYPYSLSAEQQSLLDRFGYPDAFSIHFYPEDQSVPSQTETRLEIWTYHLAGREITLLNGQVIEETEIDLPTGSIEPAPYQPDQFIGAMEVESALQASGLNEYLRAPLEPYDISGGTILFGQQIAFGFHEDKLLYVESFALELEE